MQNGMSIAVVRLCSQFRTINAGEGTRINAGSDFSKSPIHFPNVSCPGKDCPFNCRALGNHCNCSDVRRHEMVSKRIQKVIFFARASNGFAQTYSSELVPPNQKVISHNEQNKATQRAYHVSFQLQLQSCNKESLNDQMHPIQADECKSLISLTLEATS